MPTLLDETIASIRPLDAETMRQARVRQNRLTKPQGSLGRLEELSVQIAGIQGTVHPDVSSKAVFVMAADHGVVQEGVSAYPQEVTAQMVCNFARGGAAINVLARQVGARVIVVDMGVASDLEPHAEVLVKKIGYGTANLASGPAMTREEAVRSVEAGIEVFLAEHAKGIQLAATGDMGIGNTTPSAAIAAAFTGLPAENVTGRGTGIDDERWQAKVNAVQRGLEVNKPDPGDGLDVLSKVGGFEIGGLAGIMLAGAAHRVPVVIDGFISGAAALIAVAIEPQVKDFLIAGHQSAEPGHRAIMHYLRLQPLLNLNMRLGEGTGAVLAMTLIEASVKILNEMATFEQAGVSERL